MEFDSIEFKLEVIERTAELYRRGKILAENALATIKINLEEAEKANARLAVTQVKMS